MPLKIALPKGVYPPTNPLLQNLGRVLFIYNEVYTNQVIYSLYRTMKNTQIKQLAFVGKQSVPANLRKDRWRPMACVHFPTPRFGLSTFRLLREFRKMHETQYNQELLKLPKDERKKKLQNQKANSVADLAAALEIQLDPAREAEMVEKLKRRLQGPSLENAKSQLRERRNNILPQEVVIKWQDVSDGELAQNWPGEVVHQRGTRPERYAFAKEDLPLDLQEILLRGRKADVQAHIDAHVKAQAEQTAQAEQAEQPARASQVQVQAGQASQAKKTQAIKG